MSKEESCSFCKRDENQVFRLIAGADASICDKCIEICVDTLQEDASKETTPKESSCSAEVPADIPTPKEIKKELDNYIVGQHLAKKKIAVSVYNHYKHICHNDECRKSNVILIGPTGSGKTLIAKTLARILDVPFVITDATTVTEAGYVGEDVENILLSLLQATNFDIKKAEKGLIYIDEIDKIRKTSGNASITRDVSGEGVQQALLKIIEGTIAKIPPKGGRKHPDQKYIEMDTTNIMFIVGGAFVGLDKIIQNRIGKSSIGFHSSSKDKDSGSKIMKELTVRDMIKFGIIPEFAGRFNILAVCDPLDVEDLVSVLTEPKDAIIKQYIELFKLEGANLSFTKQALIAIAEKAKKMKTGARALQTIIDHLLLPELMFEIPSLQEEISIKVDEESVLKGEPISLNSYLS